MLQNESAYNATYRSYRFYLENSTGFEKYVKNKVAESSQFSIKGNLTCANSFFESPES